MVECTDNDLRSTLDLAFKKTEIDASIIEINDNAESTPKNVDCIVFYLTRDNLHKIQSILEKYPHESTRYLAIADGDDDETCQFADQINADDVLYQPLVIQDTVDALQDILSAEKSGEEIEEANKRQKAWLIEQYQKRHGEELPPDVWKARTIARLQKESRDRAARINRKLITGILVLILLILIGWLISLCLQ